jgi:hypothetical protein
MSDEEKAAKAAKDAEEAARKAAETEEEPDEEPEPVAVDFSTMGKDAFPAFLKEWNQFKKDVGWTPGKKPESTFAKVFGEETPPKKTKEKTDGEELSLDRLIFKPLEEFWGP